MVSTAIDLATFGQLFLNGGVCGHTRILAPTTIAAMTRNQIPGIGAHYLGYYFPEACYGLGWQVVRDWQGPAWALTLASRTAYCHGGWGGSVLWIDPAYELVGVYLPAQILPEDLPKSPAPWLPDCGWRLFADAMTATIEEL